VEALEATGLRLLGLALLLGREEVPRLLLLPTEPARLRSCVRSVPLLKKGKRGGGKRVMGCALEPDSGLAPPLSAESPRSAVPAVSCWPCLLGVL